MARARWPHYLDGMKLPQFSLRELFMLTALVALSCGWWAEHRRAAGLQSEVSIFRLLAKDETFTKSHAVPFAVGNTAGLIQMIQSAIGPEEWTDRGGAASMSYFPRSKSLLVSGDGRIQVRVATYLEKLERFDKKAKEYGQSWRNYDEIVSAP